jgi:hypothetical protein
MIVRTLEKETSPFRPKEVGEVVLRPEYLYLSVIGALMYLTNNIRPGIDFAVICLKRRSAAPTMCHWYDIKNILRYLVGIIDLGLFFQKNQESGLIGYADDSYVSDPRNVRS